MEEQTAAPRARIERPADDTLQFYIPATSSLFERRPRTLKQGDTFAVFDHYGDIVPLERSPDGLFHEDTRYLSRLELQINGRRPLLLSSTVQDDNLVLASDLTNPDIYEDGRLVVPKDTVHIYRSKFLWNGACYERMAIRNFDARAHGIAVNLRFEADFVDLFEVRGHVRPRRGRQSVARLSADSITLSYAGLDGIKRETNLRFHPAPARLDPSEAVFEFSIDPGDRAVLFMVVSCGEMAEESDPSRVFFTLLRQAHRTRHSATKKAATVETSNTVLNEVLCQSFADLHMLLTHTDHGLYPYAGIPWFSAPFGRDGIITAMETLWIDPEIAKGVLKYLAATQATEVIPEASAEPGKILHETRQGEMARLHEVPFHLYYGSVDATPLFVMLAGLYFERTGDLETIKALWPHIEAALKWIDSYGDPDGDGFVEYDRETDSGLVNQGWKDSHDSIFQSDGGLAWGLVALCEVQGYVFAAKRLAASMARAMAMAMMASTLESQAEALREKFEEAFWCEDLSTYALALDGNKRPCRVRTSNAGHALFTQIASRERAERVAETLLTRNSFSGWGIRTVAREESRYNPMSYHNGSVWPHDNALIALGMARYGLKEQVLRIFGGLFDASSYMDLRRLPELFCGLVRRQRKGPTFYPVACSPQAWASAAPFALLQASLGLELDHKADEIRFKFPLLPDFLDEVLIRRLRLGESTVDILLRRHESDVAVNVLERSGSARVIVIS